MSSSRATLAHSSSTKRGDAARDKQSPSIAWKSGLEFVRNDDDCPDEDAGLLKLSLNKPQDPEKAQESVRRLLDDYDQNATLSKCMKHARPLVEGLQFVSSLGSAVAAFDPHGAAPVAWAAAQVVLTGIKRYYDAFDKIEGFIKEMNDEIARLRKWQAPAASTLYSRSLQEVFRKHAQFCVALTAYLKAKSSTFHILKSSGRVTSLIDDVRYECNNALKNAEATTANNFSIAFANQSKELSAIRGDVTGIREDVAQVQDGVYDIQQGITGLQDSDRRQEYKDFLRWVGFYDTSRYLETAHKERLAGTGAWIYEQGEGNEDPVMRKWLSSGHLDYRILWMTADPGFGKTCLTARIIKELAQFDRRGVAYFFCKAYDNNTHSVQAILQSWIYQLIRIRDGVAHLSPPYEYEGFINEEPVSVPSLCEILEQLSSQDKPVRLIVDGLDECRVQKEDAEDDFAMFFDVLAKLPDQWKVLIVSRNSPEFKRQLLDKLGDVVKTKEILIKDTKADLTSFVQDRLSTYSQQKGWDKDFYEKVSTKIEERANGMFMWIKLLAKQLTDKASDDEDEIWQQILSQPDLGEVYKAELRALIKQQIYGDDYVYPLIRTLRWAVCTFRPLSIRELEAAFGQTGVLHERLAKHLGSFVRINPPSWQVELVHETAGAFILEQASSMPLYKNRFKHAGQAETHSEIAMESLRILSTVDPHKKGKALVASKQSNDPGGYLQEFYDRFADFLGFFPGSPFLGYAANFWQYHLIRSTPNDDLCDMLLKLCNSDLCTVRWLMLLSKTKYSDEEFRGISKLLPEVHRPAYDKWLSRILDQPGGRLARLDRYWNRQLHDLPPAIHVAALFDFARVVASCICRGYSADDLDRSGNQPLSRAAMGDSLNAARTLIAAGANVNASGFNADTALNISIARGPGPGEYPPDSLAVAKLLLNAGAEPNCVSKTRETPWKAINRLPQSQPQVQEVRELLKSRGAVPLMGWQYPVEEAAKFLNKKRMKEELEKGTDPNVLCDRGATRLDRTIFESPLHAALSPFNRDPEMVRMLLGKGASVNMRQSDGRTPLHLAVRKADGCTQLLIERGVDCAAQADDGSTALHDALKLPVDDRSEVIKALQNKFPSIFDLKDSWGRTPADKKDQYAIREGRPTLTDSSSKQHPTSASEVFAAYAALERKFKFRAPRNVVLKIMHQARYWLRDYRQRNGLVKIDERKWKTEYLRSAPLTISHAENLREIRFTAVSRDQGNSIFPFGHGSYEKSNSWCDWWANDASGEEIDRKGDTPFLFDNVHADIRPREYVVAFGRHPPPRRTPIGLPPFDFYRVPPWIDHVRTGDTFWLGMGAHAPGWECWIFCARIEVFTFPLLEHVKEIAWEAKPRKKALDKAPVKLLDVKYRQKE